VTEISLKERLQPALLDRLIDEARHITLFRITVKPEDLKQLGLSLPDLLAILAGQGLRAKDDELESKTVNSSTEETIVLDLAASVATVSPAQLKSFTIRPPGAPSGIALQAFCLIESTSSVNVQRESADKRMISMRKLRDSVQRDLGWLLNSASLDTTENLAPYPQVARSVINFGLPSFAGTALHSIDPQATAQRIREAIETFEPRLSRVQVSSSTDEERHDTMTLAFRIEGELWGQPTTQHVVLQTSIDIETGDVRVGEAAGAQ